MIYKKVRAIVLGVTLVVAATSVFADGLSLSSSGISSAIKVNCNGKTLPSNYELQPNSNLSNIPWIAISTVFGSTTLNCTFTLDNTTQDVVGTAQLNLDVWGNKGDASHVEYNPAYAVTITPGQNIDAQSLSINIQKS